MGGQGLARAKSISGETLTGDALTPVAALTQERLQESLNYNPETGVFTRRIRSRLAPGTIVGSINRTNGYRLIRLDGVTYRAGRLAWRFVHGEWPNGIIDHINCNRDDNRIANLRIVDHAVNSQNRRNAHAGSATGLLGAYRDRKRFFSKIVTHGKAVRLGTFDTAEEAHAAYVRAKRDLHEGCTL